MAYITGTVLDDTGTPVGGRIVRAYRRDTGALIGLKHSESSSVVADNSTVLLTNFDFDISDKKGRVLANSSAVLSVEQSKFSALSLKCGYNIFISTPYVLDDFGWFLRDYTIEAWIYMAVNIPGVTVNPVLVGNNQLFTGCYWAFGPYLNNKVALSYYTGSQNFVIGSTAITTGAWHHIAMTHASGTIKLWLDGVCDATASVNGTPQHTTDCPLEIGRSQHYFDGYVNDLRLTKGVARYTANFTPPTEPLSAIPIGLQAGGYYIQTTYTGEVDVICLDDSGGTTYNDRILRTTPV